MEKNLINHRQYIFDSASVTMLPPTKNPSLVNMQTIKAATLGSTAQVPVHGPVDLSRKKADLQKIASVLGISESGT